MALNDINTISMTINYNEYKTSYFETVNDYLKEMGINFFYQWTNPSEKSKAIQTNNLWTILYYPDHPANGVGYAASTLEALLQKIESVKK